MHLHFERNSNARCDCAILSLTWMGKVPDELPEEEGWKLNRTNYYQEGWLATGNVRGIVGVTFTTSHCRKNPDFPLRTNYNLRGHRSEVILVKWNEPYQKLASCDSSGIIFVWIKYEGRWSIELINDRNTPVTHFAWSHDGRMALICYQDGFVLVGSVAGQRYWSSMLSLESTITCGIWTPDDQQVYFGTTSGRLIVMDVHGAMVSQVQLAPDHGPITAMAWSCEKFKMEESDEGAAAAAASDHHISTVNEERGFVLAVSLKSGVILLMKNFDDVSPVVLRTGLLGVCMEWSNSRELLAVAGTRPSGDNFNTFELPSSTSCTNMLLFYSDTGTLVYSVSIPFTQSPVTALTWGHNDKRLFVATGCHVHIAWVSRRIASLQLLSGLRTHEQLRGELQVAALPLPPRIRALVTNLFAQTIRVSECFVPEVQHIREFVSRPPVGSVRLHCTMIRHDEESSAGTCYTLYLEYLGGLVPLLKGKRTSKIRPEFVIFDPQHDDSIHDYGPSPVATTAAAAAAAAVAPEVPPCSDSSDSEHDEGCASPRVQRRKRRRRKSQGSPGTEDLEDLTYVDTLPEHVRLVQVTSNIWGTKFKIHGLATSLPANLGQVTYKTSLLHLQPRQMTLVMTELRDDVPPGPDPSFNPNLFSEDEEEVPPENDRLLPSHTDIAPIAPMTPRPQSARSRFQARATRTPVSRESLTCEDSNYRTGVSSGTAPRHTLPPLCGGDTQSTKHTVAPRDSMDVLTDTQGVEYSSSVHRIKSSMMSEASSASSNAKESVSVSSLRTKRREKAAAAASCHKPQRRDDDVQSQQQGSSKRSPVVSGLPMDPMVRSCSVGYLDLVDLALNSHGPLGDLNQNETPPKRLVLVHKKKEQPKPKLKHCGKSKSLDSSDIFPKEGVTKSSLLLAAASETTPPVTSTKGTPTSGGGVTPGPSTVSHTTKVVKSQVQTRREVDGTGRILLVNATDGMNSSPSPNPRLPHSTPTSPAMAKKNRNRNHSPIRQLLNSPLLSRRARKGRNATESSDDEGNGPGEDARNFRDLETFQKAQLRQKLRRGKGATGDTGNSTRRRELVMHNKAPMWNENSQVYQLDFGGRVTQESAKNFQIEFRGKQVMQFGRIDGNAYTLDFQYPFSALQAFAVALANVTQRLK